MASNYTNLYLVLISFRSRFELTIPRTCWAGSFLSHFAGVRLVLESFRQRWRTPVFCLVGINMPLLICSGAVLRSRLLKGRFSIGVYVPLCSSCPVCVHPLRPHPPLSCTSSQQKPAPTPTRRNWKSQRGGVAKTLSCDFGGGGGKRTTEEPPPKPVFGASESGIRLVCARFL